MDNDNELMKKFNETMQNNSEPTVIPYRAVQNQNTFVSNEVNNVNNSNNSQNITMPNFVKQNNSINMVPEINNNVINNPAGNVNVQNNGVNGQIPNNNQLHDTTSPINSDPVVNKKKKTTIKINPELKTAIILAIVLLIAMSFIPRIFDFIDWLKIKIFG